MKSSNVTLRPAAFTDVDTLYSFICELENQRFNKASFKKIYEGNINDERNVYVLALEDQNVVGYISCHFQYLLHHCGLVGEVQELFVHPEKRKLGIGNLMLKHIVLKAKEKGAVQLEVTSKNFRETAHRFYLSKGFEFTHKKFVYLIQP